MWDAAAAAEMKKLVLSRFRSIRAAARMMGVDHSNLARVLRGETPPSAALLEKLAGVGIFPAGFPEIQSRLLAEQDRKLVEFSDPECPAWRFARETALGWYESQQRFLSLQGQAEEACRCPRFDPAFTGTRELVSHNLPFYPCTPFEIFAVNVTGFFCMGGVASPAAARGLLKVLLEDFYSDHSKGIFLDWVDNEVAQEVITRRLFFHAVLYTIDPVLYVVEGGVLQINQVVRSACTEAVIPIPKFAIAMVRRFK
ncbi:hypothetical protein EDD75_0323 [Thermodesulfitimonas autotrophica]|uniref:HTH cro/C1-type domain-containing protein n=1 Tax=Thermodesulfitimonas autotrophica TaxID=1894989 RepID=A0A3N5AX54_9THEO|nr:helix-turn-helix transcriptional regulator [Thermodesulfitimonas autotrophica]RPF49507.1 hypothetical protein EDD75_0323 [Thermodesulfitimonas autotrophica]